MINTDKLKGIIAEKGTSQRQLAIKLGMTEKTFYTKMKNGVFGSDEIDGIVKYLGMRHEEAISIFFVNNVTQQVTGEAPDDINN